MRTFTDNPVIDPTFVVFCKALTTCPGDVCDELCPVNKLKSAESLSLLKEGVFLPAGSVRMVRGEGMPQYRNPFDKGDLYVKFDVQFPQNNWISPEKLVV